MEAVIHLPISAWVVLPLWQGTGESISQGFLKLQIPVASVIFRLAALLGSNRRRSVNLFEETEREGHPSGLHCSITQLLLSHSQKTTLAFNYTS